MCVATNAASRYGSHMNIMHSNRVLAIEVTAQAKASSRHTELGPDRVSNPRDRLTLVTGFALAALIWIVTLFAPMNTALAQTQTDSIITRSVVVQEGETLRSIARREFGKSGLSSMLANFNALQESDALFAGQIIRIPLFTPVERQFATVIFVKGDVVKNNIEVKRDDKVYLHELLVTGEAGFAAIQFSSGSVVTLQPNTHAKLERLNCLDSDASCLIVLDSAQGEVSSDVNRRDGQPTEFTIKTPYASAAVRGTIFEMNAVSSKLLVGVTEGEVLLQGASDLPLDQGFGTVAQVDLPPLDPIALLPAPVYRYIPTRAAKGDTISWWALSDVEQYLINLSSDEDGLEVVANYNETQGILAVDDINAGEYFMNVRGIDSNGLKGFKSPTKIVVAAIDENVEPVETEVSRVGNEFLVKIIDPPETAPGYEIQVSTKPDFTDPLSVDVSNPGTAIFRLQSDKIYTRARVLLEPEKVSAFGSVAESQ